MGKYIQCGKDMQRGKSEGQSPKAKVKYEVRGPKAEVNQNSDLWTSAFAFVFSSCIPSWSLHVTNPADAAAQEYLARIQTVITYIEHHMDEDLTLEVLSRVSCFSAFHFHRIFTAFVGEQPAGFVRRVRLDRSAQMLTGNTTESITAIALRTGFSSSAVFARAFRARFGIAPSGFRVQKSKERIDESKKSKARDLAMQYHVGVPSSRHRRTPGVTALSIIIKDMPAKHVAYVANLKGYKTKLISAAWEKLTRWAEPLELLAPPAEAIGISFDDPGITPPDKCRYYSCLTIPADVQPPRGIGVLDIPAGRHAVYSFDGTREQIAGAYARLYREWLPESGWQPGDHPCYEIYSSSPDDDPEGRFVMDICMPVTPL
jgi:AraC family transcriptional regulator